MSNQPPIEVPQGAIRLNTDSQKLEFYAQDRWHEMATDTPNLGRDTDVTASARGIFSGGRSQDRIEYITIASLGNASPFGDATVNHEGGAVASRTRYCGAGTVSYSDVIDFVTFASTGNAQDFGDLTDARRSMNSCSNQTRGLFLGGIDAPGQPTSNIVDFITIATTGNAVDYGDLITTSSNCSGNAGNPIRGLCLGGTPSTTGSAQFVTIPTLGNSSTFGDLISSQGNRGACSNSIRVIHGYEGSLDFLTIATLGNATSFGDYLNDAAYRCGVASPTRVVFGGGSPGINTMGYVQIATQGDAVDFGDLTVNHYVHVGGSNGHGGL
tara:strand:+ start:962 stop:1939 length:978 start_codon:yes stop_codon:yes gene_type:complete